MGDRREARTRATAAAAVAVEFVLEQRRRHQIAALPLEETAILQLAKLPDYHRDPFDRMLVCLAISHELTILTPDPAISSYPVPTVW